MSHLTDNAVDLPRLPIPSLDATCQRYLNSLQGLQSAQEHNQTKNAVDFFKNNEGPILDKKLREYANDKYSYIEEFWDESYLNYSDSVVLALNPFFILEDDPTPSRGSQLMRASSLIISSLGFVHDLRCNLLEPDNVRGVPLDMSQYKRLFGTSRIPTQNGCVMRTKGDSKHIIIARKGQFYWFDVIDHENRPLFTEQDLHHNLKSIVDDADSNNSLDASGRSIGVLTTENRKIWSSNRDFLGKNTDNGKNIDMIDQVSTVCGLLSTINHQHPLHRPSLSYVSTTLHPRPLPSYATTCYAARVTSKMASSLAPVRTDGMTRCVGDVLECLKSQY